MATKIADVVVKVVEILKPFNSADQLRILETVAKAYGIDLTPPPPIVKVVHHNNGGPFGAPAR